MFKFFPDKEGLVSGGVGRVKGKFADAELKNAYATGTLPVTFTVEGPDCAGNKATSTVWAR